MSDRECTRDKKNDVRIPHRIMKTINGEPNWNGVATTIAALIGLLALIVSAYTAYVERQQVRAQVWPYLLMGSNDLDQSLDVFNKGVGPAIVRSVEIQVDGRPQRDWDHVFDALGLAHHKAVKTFFSSGTVVSPGETIAALKLLQKDQWEQFSSSMSRLRMHVCFCSTLGECWLADMNNPLGAGTPQRCPAVPEKEQFRD